MLCFTSRPCLKHWKAFKHYYVYKIIEMAGNCTQATITVIYFDFQAMVIYPYDWLKFVKCTVFFINMWHSTSHGYDTRSLICLSLSTLMWVWKNLEVSGLFEFYYVRTFLLVIIISSITVAMYGNKLWYMNSYVYFVSSLMIVCVQNI